MASVSHYRSVGGRAASQPDRSGVTTRIVCEKFAKQSVPVAPSRGQAVHNHSPVASSPQPAAPGPRARDRVRRGRRARGFASPRRPPRPPPRTARDSSCASSTTCAAAAAHRDAARAPASRASRAASAARTSSPRARARSPAAALARPAPAPRGRLGGALARRRRGLRPQRLRRRERGRPAGGWATVQWELNGPFGINAPAAWSQASQARRQRRARASRSRSSTAASRTATRGPYTRSPDLAPSRFVRGYDFIDNDPYPNDEFGHGTFVASIIGATANNGYGTVGVAYRAKIMPVRVLDFEGKSDAATIAAGMRYAVEHGADVINLSLELFDAPPLPPTPRSVMTSRTVRDGAGRDARRAASSSCPRPATASTCACPASATTRSRSTSAARPSTAASATTPTTVPGMDVVAPGGGVDASLPGDPNCHPDGVAGPRHLGRELRGQRAEALRDPAGLPRHLVGRAARDRASSRSCSRRACSARIRRRVRSSATSSARRATSARPGPTATTARAARCDRATAPIEARAASRRRHSRPDDEHRAGRVVGDLVRHRAEQEALGAGHALVADDDEVRAALLGDVEDRVGRIALTGEDLDRRRRPRGSRAAAASSVASTSSRGLMIQCRSSRHGDRLAQPRVGDRLVGADELDPRADRPRERRRLAHRLAGGVRAVDAHDDRGEHQRLSHQLDDRDDAAGEHEEHDRGLHPDPDRVHRRRQLRVDVGGRLRASDVVERRRWRPRSGAGRARTPLRRRVLDRPE